MWIGEGLCETTHFRHAGNWRRALHQVAFYNFVLINTLLPAAFLHTATPCGESGVGSLRRITAVIDVDLFIDIRLNAAGLTLLLDPMDR